MGGLSKKEAKKRERIHRHGQQCDCRGSEKGVEIEESIEEINVDGGKLKIIIN